MQEKSTDKPLTMSQLKPERHSSSNLHQIEQLVKVRVQNYECIEIGLKNSKFEK